MNKKDELISRILDIEWDLFHNVRNTGGTAPCQDDRQTFEINRSAQSMSWSEAALESYLNDLLRAKMEKRNLMTEKYAHMMKSTWPEEYDQMLPHIPPVAPEVSILIDKLLEIKLEWQEELAGKYPHLIKRGRPLRSTEDTPAKTSFETYLRGELATYSIQTLELYYENVLRHKSENINGGEITLDHIIKSYGYTSAWEANDLMARKSLD